MVQDRNTPDSHLPTSTHLERMRDMARDERVSIAWLMDRLGERSFGLTLFIMAVIALLPGASTVAGVLIAWPAIQMILGHDVAVLPGPVARRKIATARLSRVIGFVTPRLRWVERLIRPRWQTPFQTTKRLTGVLMLLLGLTMISPVPFSHVLPAVVIMLLALAYLEKDGVALLIALVAALASLTLTTAAFWGAIETIDWIDPATGADVQNLSD